ncbi:MAG TPA: AraC family transcriptional regulator [Rhodanobacteraceae bacterium]|jgi:AraC family transcriptional regulator|nr:AraC family transcriptional regulator [Rhodanobacteraceae bacterium]
MHIDCERLVNGGRLDWSADEDCRATAGALRILVGFGRGCVLYGQARAATIVIPLRGRVQLSDGEQVRTLNGGELLVCESGQRVQAIGRGAALWIAVFAESNVWHQLTGDVPESAPDPMLVPAVHLTDRALRRAAVRLARIALDAERKDTALTMTAASAFATLIADLQAEFDPYIARCPGRTLAQRRAVFLRLQRVRNYMASSCHLDLDIAGFARMASYSPCHFIRAFSTVYGETPHAVLVEQRLGRAHRLINESALAITEIARASGFENRCAFSRSFKRRFGITATDLRECVRGPGLVAA